MHIFVNGVREECQAEFSLADLIKGITPDTIKLLVIVNKKLIPPENYPGHYLKSGDMVELIAPAFGG